ncbi:MAG: phosphoglycerate kinase [Gammaproteobacteria bacterium]|nr:phosphoglycerate kinase [Gammaproteobacteria bacterium]
MKHLAEENIAEKKIGLRVDLNVPIKNGEILNDERLSAALPTIQFILERTNKLCIISHLGRPEEGKFDKNYSLDPIKKWLEDKLEVSIPLIKNFTEVPDSLSIMENIRFFKGEKSNDQELTSIISESFDVYVMDAFATAHRSSSSTYGAIIKSKKACSGLLFSKEIKNLDAALVSSKNALSVVGGSKVSTKLKVIQNLLTRSSKVLVGGGIANTFLKAAGKNIGSSLVEDDMLSVSQKLLATNKIILPTHVYVADSPEANSAQLVSVDNVAADKMILDIELSNEISSIGNIDYVLWNGPLGVFEIDLFSNGTQQLISCLEETSAKVIAGGGETIFAISKFSHKNKFHYVSTAGGAFLEYLSGHKLPSVEALRLK